MRLSCHEHLLRWSPKLHIRRRAVQSTIVAALPSCQNSSRQFSASPTRRQDEREVAILGGGITGLTAAYYISRADPKARITLYEASDRLGGWLQSRRVPIDGGGSILFETGPRTLRTGGNGLVTARLLQDIKPKDDLICVPKFADASRYRYIYYPDRLNRLPAAGEGLLTRLSHVFANRALFAGLPSAAIHDFFNPTQPAPTADESIGHFVTRRFNAAPANKIVSAILHGIYAGDLNKLSVRSLFPVLPYLEGRFGSVIAGIGALGGSKTKIMEKRLWEVTSDPEIKNIDRPMVDLMSQSTVFTLHSGLGALATRLEEVLNGEERVQIKMSTPISGLGAAIEGETGRSTPTFGKIDVFTGSQNQPTAYDTVISTIPHNQFAAMLPSSSASKPPSIPSVTVMVVNLWFRNPNLLSRTPGFGYLIPRSIPYHQNPECALGVIFDGYAAPNQDLPHAREQREKYTRGSGSAEEAVMTGTKMTVMMGGHWWDGWTDFPGEEEAVNMARTVVARHLGIVEEPEQTMATLQRDCIPQYTVGHGERMKDFHYRLLREYGGNLRVAGGSYGGVGVNDCIRSAWDLGKEVREKGWRGGVTGLERYTVNNGMAEFVEVKVDKMPDRADVKARE